MSDHLRELIDGACATNLADSVGMRWTPRPTERPTPPRQPVAASHWLIRLIRQLFSIKKESN
jgi:hypothetical protein